MTCPPKTRPFRFGKRFTEGQIIAVLKEAEAGAKTGATPTRAEFSRSRLRRRSVRVRLDQLVLPTRCPFDNRILLG
jgi:hypothetical protein